MSTKMNFYSPRELNFSLPSRPGQRRLFVGYLSSALRRLFFLFFIVFFCSLPHLRFLPFLTLTEVKLFFLLVRTAAASSVDNPVSSPCSASVESSCSSGGVTTTITTATLSVMRKWNVKYANSSSISGSSGGGTVTKTLESADTTNSIASAQKREEARQKMDGWVSGREVGFYFGRDEITEWRRTFHVMDVDHSRKLEEPELLQAIFFSPFGISSKGEANLLLKKSPHVLQQLKDEFDFDGDEAWDFAEFVAFSSSAHFGVADEDVSLLLSYDTDGDGYLSSFEFRKFLTVLHRPELLRRGFGRHFRKSFEKADKDGDAKLSLEEFQNALQAELVVLQMDEAFTAIDRDSDEAISWNELKALFVDGNELEMQKKKKKEEEDLVENNLRLQEEKLFDIDQFFDYPSIFEEDMGLRGDAKWENESRWRDSQIIDEEDTTEALSEMSKNMDLDGNGYINFSEFEQYYSMSVFFEKLDGIVQTEM